VFPLSAAWEPVLLDSLAMHKKEAPLVLLVEDDTDTREMYSEYLSYSGLRVTEAPTGFRALQHVREQTPDVVVTDIWMPGMDGLELSRRLRAEPPTRDVPIIAVTGNPTEGVREAGCDVMLEKPCTPDRLLHAIEDVLDKSRD
jgi:two-component system, cell cycle response regulator DivK